MDYSISFTSRHVNIFRNGELVGYIRKENGYCNIAKDEKWAEDLRVVVLLFGA